MLVRYIYNCVDRDLSWELARKIAETESPRTCRLQTRGPQELMEWSSSNLKAWVSVESRTVWMPVSQTCWLKRAGEIYVTATERTGPSWPFPSWTTGCPPTLARVHLLHSFETTFFWGDPHRWPKNVLGASGHLQSKWSRKINHHSR